MKVTYDPAHVSRVVKGMYWGLRQRLSDLVISTVEDREAWLQSMGLQRVRHDLASEQKQQEVKSLSHVRLFVTPWTVVYEVPPWNFPGKSTTRMGFHFLHALIVGKTAPDGSKIDS